MKILYKIYKNIWNSNSNRFSYLIKKISLISISMGLFSIIISSFILNGFKAAITDKIYDFSGHFIISNYSNGLSFKNSPIDISKGIYSNYKNDEEIDSAYPFILSSALVQADKKEIEGVIFKGIQSDYLDNISSHLNTTIIEKHSGESYFSISKGKTKDTATHMLKKNGLIL